MNTHLFHATQPLPQHLQVIPELGFKSVLDSLPCYVSILDPEYRFLFLNQTIKNDFGEPAGRTCHDLLKGFSSPCTKCPVADTFRDKQIHISEGSLKVSGGDLHQIIICTAPLLGIPGNVMAVIKIAINITKVKEAHNELILLGQSMAFLSHDIKNILEGLQGGAYVVEEGIKDNDMTLAGKGWRIVKKNIFEISRVAQNILYSSKKREPEMKLVNPALLVRDVVGLFQEKAGSMGIQLVYEINPNLPAVKVDQGGVVRMLGNLVWNAIEACRRTGAMKNGMVYIRADYFNKRQYMFEVEDTGEGMDESTKRNLFRDFFTTKGNSGTGLGLVVVDRIVRQHKGRVDVLSKTGVGSLFRVVLNFQ
ncbi:MAG: ATP-binding protein [Thermodesulfobacteriota bacterium]